MTPDPTPTKWLSLAEASEWLGVHPTTLRRWADAGQIPVMLTPGGHRRFSHDDLERFATTHRLHPSAAIEQRWAAEALQHTRERLSQATAPWLQSADEQQREAQRTLGRRLMAVIVRYAEEQSEETLAEAQAIGYEYAANLQRGGLSITAALEAFLFFRDAMMEAALQLPDLAAQRHESNAGLVRRMNMVFNTVQLAMIDRYTHPLENP